MKPIESTQPQQPAISLLPVMAWLLVAVAAPAAFVWFGGNAPAKPGQQASVAVDNALPEQALKEHRDAAQEWLSSYGWIDRSNGIARVPIEEGMQSVLREGLSARKESEEDQ